jgi:hypothetical protein
MYYRAGMLKARIVGRRWDKYYDGTDAGLSVPSKIIADLAPIVAPHVDTIMEIGCGSGHNFIPFQNSHKLVGYDLVPVDRINWQCNTINLTYHKRSGEELAGFLATTKPNLSHTLFISSAVMMYISTRSQLALYAALLGCGCRNFIFIEPPADHIEYGTRLANLCFHLPLKDFQQHPVAHGRVAFVRLLKGSSTET